MLKLILWKFQNLKLKNINYIEIYDNNNLKNIKYKIKKLSFLCRILSTDKLNVPIKVSAQLASPTVFFKNIYGKS